ncbi:uncharacterized protein A4U43_C01F30980 [Asparagus officinalis]|uniref:Uncharacterized protein n=1 Tax=Asparagus officinalis TaxID=4686 RepID=A0A5P1FX15_ASPOF|nr:uncharacterized protein A4U43_C01F30980 [Asparagus officinalis]
MASASAHHRLHLHSSRRPRVRRLLPASSVAQLPAPTQPPSFFSLSLHLPPATFASDGAAKAAALCGFAAADLPPARLERDPAAAAAGEDGRAPAATGAGGDGEGGVGGVLMDRAVAGRGRGGGGLSRSAACRGACWVRVSSGSCWLLGVVEARVWGARVWRWRGVKWMRKERGAFSSSSSSSFSFPFFWKGILW